MGESGRGKKYLLQGFVFLLLIYLVPIQFKHLPQRLPLLSLKISSPCLNSEELVEIVLHPGASTMDLFYSWLIYFKSSPCFGTTNHKPTFLQPNQADRDFSRLRAGFEVRESE